MATVGVVGSTASAIGAVAEFDDATVRTVVLWAIDDQGIVAGYVIDAGAIVPAESVGGFAGYSDTVQIVAGPPAA